MTALPALVPFLLACATSSGAGSEASSGAPMDPERPSLVVFLVVDQLRGDLLDRYASVFTGGFKRLLEEGRVYTRALHDHARTETAPGHATLSTGVHPGRAGIPSNAWRVKEDGRWVSVFNVMDPGVSLVGIPDVPGGSPDVLLRTGLADWIGKASPGSRVVSVSGKARAAVLMAGKSPGDVFWFDSRVGGFVTSTFYREKAPAWLDRFNAVDLQAYRADSVWTSTIPPGAESLSAPDTAAFEGDGVNTFFPHRWGAERIDPGMDDFFMWMAGTPMLDRATLELARLAAEERDLGQDPERVDFLSVSLSQTDRVGHAYGPLSREQMDNLLRLDRHLEGFLDFLDDEVGRENYVLGLTGDHGVLTMPERLGEGRRLTSEDRTRLEGVVRGALDRMAGDQAVSLGPLLADTLAAVPFVGPAYSHEALRRGTAGDSLATLFAHSFHRGRAGGLLSVYGVEMWWKENVLDWAFPVGTTHGSPYDYDRWVPMILVGPGVEVGTVDDPVRPLDLAPSLAKLAGIPFPDDLDGKPLVVR